jgi:hypothetical protein
MVSEEEFFEKVDIADIVPTEITGELKSQRDDMMKLYAKLIANPYLAPQLIPDFRSTLMSTLGTLMENNIPVSDNPKIRTPDDVFKEGMAELGTMLGAQGIAAVMRMKKTFTDTVKSKPSDDDFVVYRDPDTMTFYYIDNEGAEIDCDEEGNPMEE